MSRLSKKNGYIITVSVVVSDIYDLRNRGLILQCDRNERRVLDSHNC